MLDPKLIRENPKIVKDSLKKRGLDIGIIDEWIKLDKRIRELKQENDELRHERNQISLKINEYKKLRQEKDAQEAIKKAKDIPEKIKKIDEEIIETETKFKEIYYQLPNLLHKNVPLTETDRIDWNSSIKKPHFKFEAKTNWELLTSLNLADFKRGIKASGDRGWVLKGDAARLVRAITNFGLDFWRKKGYLELIPPYFVNEENLYITGHYPGGEKEVYRTEDGKVFVGTAEISVLAVFKDDEFNKKDLPEKFVAYTPCFRREAGSHADDKGLYRTHQFDKIELTHITTKELEEKEFKQIFEYLKEFYKLLGLPHRIITHRAGDMPNKAIMEKDIELWLAGEKRWGEAGSIGMTGDFQARRGNIKYIGEGKKEFAHTIYATGCVANRILIAILNNYQQKDGTIKIPKALWKYTGFKIIGKKEKKK